MHWALAVICVTNEYLYSSCWLNMYQVCQRIKKIYKVEINWSPLLIYGDLNYTDPHLQRKMFQECNFD